MKKVIIVRHAKSNWDNPQLTDFERILNERGHRDAKFLAELIATKSSKPDIIISSPAIRALTTAKYFADALQYDSTTIKQDIGIYERGSKYIINILKKLDENLNYIMIFGHNPDITSLASYLSGEYFDNVPTCGVVSIVFNTDSWKNIEELNGKLEYFEYPKMYFKK